MALRDLALLLIAATAVSAARCDENPVGPSELTSSKALIQALQQQGAAVTPGGTMPRDAYPFFSVNASRLTVNGDDVFVFEYASAAAASQQAALVSPAGSPIGGTQIAWLDTPRFYTKDRLIVLYVGRKPEVIAPLEAVLGPPFAGARRAGLSSVRLPSGGLT